MATANLARWGGLALVLAMGQTQPPALAPNPKTNTVAFTIKIESPMGKDARIAAGEGSVWVSGADLSLVRIDPRTNRVVQIFTGGGHSGLAVAYGSVWLAGSSNLVWRLDPKRVEATRSLGASSPSR